MPERTSKVAKTFNDIPKKEGLKYKYPQDIEQITFQLDILVFSWSQLSWNWLYEIKDKMRGPQNGGQQDIREEKSVSE